MITADLSTLCELFTFTVDIAFFCNLHLCKMWVNVNKEFSDDKNEQLRILVLVLQQLFIFHHEAQYKLDMLFYIVTMVTFSVHNK